MGKLEKESRKRTRITSIQKAILETIAIAGLLSIAAVTPNMLGTLAKMGIIKKPRRDSVHRSRNRLVEHGLLEYKGKFIRLTKKGESELRRVQTFSYKLKKPRRWDGKWRVLIFDIPEKRKVLRNKMRETLLAIGFKRLQDSVWVYPYDCEDLITLLKADFRIGKDVLYLIVDTMENDRVLRSSFDL